MCAADMKTPPFPVDGLALESIGRRHVAPLFGRDGTTGEAPEAGPGQQQLVIARSICAELSVQHLVSGTGFSGNADFGRKVEMTVYPKSRFAAGLGGGAKDSNDPEPGKYSHCDPPSMPG